jgi:hypothetical protein
VHLRAGQLISVFAHPGFSNPSNPVDNAWCPIISFSIDIYISTDIYIYPEHKTITNGSRSSSGSS